MQAWNVLSSERVIHDPPWLIVRKDQVEREHTSHHYWVLEQPAWVNVVAVTDDDLLVLVRQYRHGIARESLEIPGGYAESDDPLADAQRELREETGYGGGSWSLLQRLSPNPALQDNWMHTYLATGVELLGDPEPDDGEDLQLELHPADAVRRLISEGEIIHALHVAPLLAYDLHRMQPRASEAPR